MQRLWAYLPLLFSSTSLAATLSIDIKAISINQGNVLIGVFNQANTFPYGEPFLKQALTPDNQNIQTQFKLDSGRYAVAVFQDSNGNRQLDKNFWGIPKEKYGFSGQAVKKQPTFSQASINVQQQTTISITLQ